MSSKEQKQVRKDLYTLCSYAKGAQQYSNINDIVDNLRDNILHRVEQLENTLALNRLVDERLIEDVKKKASRLEIDTYDEEGNQD